MANSIVFSDTPKELKIRNRLKLVFFVKQGVDSFLCDIIDGLSKEYEVKKIIVTEYRQIDEGMLWADICWFEWCDELITYGSKLQSAKLKIIICRLHSYEAFTDYIHNVSWDNVDRIIFVAEHIKENVLKKVDIDKDKANVIYNGINFEKFKFNERKKGFNIAYVGYINFKKGPMLLLHTFKAIFDKDSRYKLYIAGQYQEERYFLYFQQMIKEMGLQNNVIYDGWQDDINKWLDDKNYILCTSVLEGNPIGVMEAMARGIKPLIHNFVGAKLQFDKYVWNSINECLEMVISNEYNSKEYKDYIANNYSLEKQIISIKNVIKDIKKR
ncbi:glycosyltransferase family 4 protein [Clostridium estertheticum]|uniref:glycosyltransferase family 4 protein n=1 Tax=Clostridium estertheticum TaxID=238834 RepID=UPI001C6E2CCE|nr:glycosyltransferase family 4 protein [Clostridium estertheticum]MBW9154757.1 glycosyltransferase family 4 protein [Clostridium estertheticum]WLC84965.1 glycosyltransferase family 4 protein [Clostridium estertheticum]